MQISLKFSLAWVLFALFVSVLAPCGILNMYWGKFHHVHALFISVVHCCMPSVCQNVQVTFLNCLDSNEFQCLGLPLIDHARHVLIIRCVFYTLCPFLCLNAMPCTHYAHIRHLLGTPHAPHAALTCISSCTYMHNTDTHMHSHVLHALCFFLHVLAVIALMF